VLDARGLEVTAEDRARITSCTDLKQLMTWVKRAATISAAIELFT